METPEQIACKAYELYMNYGIHGVTMNDIACQLRISKKTIYRYFESKNVLVERIITQKVEENKVLLNVQRDTLKDAVGLLVIDLKTVCNLFGKLNPGIIFNLEKYHPSAFGVLTDYIDGFIYKIIEKDIRQGIEQGFFRENVDSHILIHFLLQNLQSLFGRYTRVHLVNSKEPETDLLNHFLYGIIKPETRICTDPFLCLKR